MKVIHHLRKYDLESGKLLKKYVAQTSGESAAAERSFNDSAIAKNGDIYFTYSVSIAFKTKRSR